MIIMIKKSYSLYNVVSVREEFWVSPWFVSHAKNVIRGAYDDGGHFHCNIIDNNNNNNNKRAIVYTMLCQ